MSNVRIIFFLFLLGIFCIAGYVIYMQANYYRIEDHTALETEHNPVQTLQTGETYTAVTYNIGFGAYGPDYSFFMDTDFAYSDHNPVMLRFELKE